MKTSIKHDATIVNKDKQAQQLQEELNVQWTVFGHFSYLYDKHYYVHLCLLHHL